MGKLLAEERKLFSILFHGDAGQCRTEWKQYAYEHGIGYEEMGEEDAVMYLSEEAGMLFDVTDHSGYPSRMRIMDEYEEVWKEALTEEVVDTVQQSGIDVYELAAIAGYLSEQTGISADEKMYELLEQTEEY